MSGSPRLLPVTQMGQEEGLGTAGKSGAGDTFSKQGMSVRHITLPSVQHTIRVDRLRLLGRIATSLFRSLLVVMLRSSNRSMPPCRALLGRGAQAARHNTLWNPSDTMHP